MSCDPLTYRQGQEIIQKLDKILEIVDIVYRPTITINQVPSMPPGGVVEASVKDQSIPIAKTGFDLFWSVYPRKIGKGAAELAWKKIRPDDTLQVRIVDAVKAQCKSEQWKRDGGQFIPHPATWLNGKRWEDVLDIAIAQDKPPVMFKTTPTRPPGEAPPPEVREALSKLLGRDMSF